MSEGFKNLSLIFFFLFCSTQVINTIYFTTTIFISANQRQNVDPSTAIWDSIEFCLSKSVSFHRCKTIAPGGWKQIKKGRPKNGSPDSTAVTITYVLFDGGIYILLRLAFSL